LVYSHARGLGDHDKSVAERLAKLGYVALACDLHGNGQELATLAETFERLQPLRDSPTKVPRARRLHSMPCCAGPKSILKR